MKTEMARVRAGVLAGLIVLAACGGGAAMGGGPAFGAVPTAEALQAVAEWQVVQLPGVAALPSTDRPTMQFTEDARVAGRTGCNQYSGSYERTDASVTFGQMVSTRMACPGGRMELETAFLAALDATRSLALNDQALSLLGEGGTLLARLVPAS